jgi:magnesium transporter
VTPEGRAAAAALQHAFVRTYPEDVAHIVEEWPPADLARLFETEAPGPLVAVLDHLSPDTAARLLDHLPAARASELLLAVEPGRAALLLARVESDRQEALLADLTPALAAEIRELMAYPPDSAGRLMDVRVTTARPDARAAAVLERARRAAVRGTEVVLVEDDGSLAGVLPIEDVALASPDAPVRSLIRRTPVRIQALAPREDVVELLTHHALASLPVVDAADRVVGVIRHSALVRAAEEEASADIQTMVGASAEERALSPPSLAVRKRLPWLQINLVTAFLAAAVVGVFEGTIAQFTALAVLLPVVAGQSGNTGAQALAVTMRGLVLREIRVRHWRRVLLKEAFVGLVNGVGVAVTTATAVYVWSQSTGLAAVIGVSMVISMICAGLAGAAVPIGLAAARQDPAQSSSIILTTVTDVVGFFSFLGIATLLASRL